MCARAHMHTHDVYRVVRWVRDMPVRITRVYVRCGLISGEQQTRRKMMGGLYVLSNVSYRSGIHPVTVWGLAAVSFGVGSSGLGRGDPPLHVFL